jgi:hypothetical protein
MAPEQAGGKLQQVGPAADVYALGAILYELLTGRPPFKAETPLDTVLQVISQEPLSPSRLQPHLPRDLTTVCLKCLEKEPVRRYPSARALADDLRRLREGEPIQARPISVVGRAVKWTRRRPAVAGLLAALAVAVVGGLLATTTLWLRAEDQRAAAEQARADALAQRDEVQQERQRARERLVQQYVVNGERLVDAGDVPGSLIWFAEALKEEEGNPAREAVYRTRLGLVLRQMPRLIGMWETTPGKATQNHAPLGRRVALLSGTGARLWDTATGQPAGPLWSGATTLDLALVSADGRRVATVRNARDDKGWEIHLWSADTGESWRLSPRRKGRSATQPLARMAASWPRRAPTAWASGTRPPANPRIRRWEPLPPPGLFSAPTAAPC